MTAFGVYLAACALLAVAGVAKVRRPGHAALALGRAVPLLAGRTRAAVLAVRTVAAAEAVLGVVGALFPAPAAASAVAASYAVFAAVVLVLRARRGPLATCGCLGEADTPATGLHAVIDAGLAGAAAVVAATLHHATIGAALRGQPLAGVPLVAGAAVVCALCVAAMSVLAKLQAVRRQPVV